MKEQPAFGQQYYRSARHKRKVLRPLDKFYKLYNQKQIFDIMLNLDIHREIPLQYSYLEGGADYWNHYAQKLLGVPVRNTLTSTIELLKLNQAYLDRLLDSTQRVNIIDLGPGNGLPVKDLLKRLYKKGILGRYVGIDVSKEMLSVVRSNIEAWLQGKVQPEGHLRDITNDRFNDLLINEHFGANAETTRNIVLLLGGTLTNLRAPDEALQTIRKSMGKNDLIIYSRKLDTLNSRQYFDFGVSTESNEILAPNHRLILDLLNIDESNYEVEKFYDEQQSARFIYIKLKGDISLELEDERPLRPILFKKGERILVWRSWHEDAFEAQRQFDENGFDILQTSKTEDHEYLLLIAAIKTAI